MVFEIISTRRSRCRRWDDIGLSRHRLDILKDKTGGNLTDPDSEIEFLEFPRPNDEDWGYGDFVSRDTVLDASNNILNDGTLTFEVRIRPHKDYICRDAVVRLGQN
eukprot:scaffold73670_cov39-Cyclotella_meneghiniana.AAC.1